MKRSFLLFYPFTKRCSMLLVLVLAWSQNEVSAQDPVFSQFFAAPLHLNPGFTGSILEFRAGVNSRLQWPSYDNPVVTNYVYADFNIRNLNSGVGLSILVDDVGPLRSTQVNLLYSYKINIAKKMVLMPGLRFGYDNRNFALNNYVFASELARGLPDAQVQTAGVGRINYPDFGSGVVGFGAKYWFGFAADHLNRPNVSSLNDVDRLDIKWTAHGGMKIRLYNGLKTVKTIPYILPSFVYRSQSGVNQLDFGAQIFKEPLMLGLWYKGTTLFSSESTIQTQKALVFMSGLNFKQLELGYSYDFLLSEINASSGGAHEISLSYQFNAINRAKQKANQQKKELDQPPPFLREKWWSVN
jgi:type IX secretion system PorP/SprF family membrane protein